MKPTTVLRTSLALLSAIAPTFGHPPQIPSVANDHHDIHVPVGRRAGSSPPRGKYFNEPGVAGELSHYDIRFFQGALDYDEHRQALRNLVRSYLDFCREKGIETWLAHGTLLGWWWNGRIMPWDYDVDVQVAEGTMDWLVAEGFNTSKHEFVWDDRGGSGQVVMGAVKREEERDDVAVDEPKSDEDDEKPESHDDGRPRKEYMIDVNPHYTERRLQDGFNVIDGRWIDTSNGAFIDITALSEHKQDKPGQWFCKGGHRYGTDELYPLRKSEFEGAPAWVPHSFERILTAEYGQRCLSKKHFEGHGWDEEVKEWVKDNRGFLW